MTMDFERLLAGVWRGPERPLDIADGQVQTVRSIVNPDKLRHLGPVGDLNALLGGG